MTAKSNLGKVKLTHNRTGKSFFKTPEEAEAIQNHPRFKGVYTPEHIAGNPPELEDKKPSKKSSGAVSDKKTDDSTK